MRDVNFDSRGYEPNTHIATNSKLFSEFGSRRESLNLATQISLSYPTPFAIRVYDYLDCYGALCPVFTRGLSDAGADPGFSLEGGGGGGAKDYVPARTLRARNRTHFRQGSRARLRALEALGLF